MSYLLQLHCLLSLLLVVCHSTILKSSLPINLLSQNYLQGNSTIDKIPQIGVNITSLILTSSGYNTDSLEVLQSLSAIENINAYLMDLYWNGSRWIMCPQDIMILQGSSDSVPCKISFQQVLESLSYNTTATNQVGGLLSLFFNLHVQQNDTLVNDWLSDVLQENFGALLYTPNKHSHRNYTYPLYYESSAIDQWNIVAMLWNNNSKSIKLNETAIFQDNEDGFKLNYFNNQFSSSHLNMTNDLTFLSESSDPDDFAQRNSLSWKFTTVNSKMSTNLTYLRQIMLNGLTSVINIDYQNNFNYSLLNSVSWSWQLDADLSPKTKFQFSETYDTSQFRDAYYCAVYFNGGSYVDNCYRQHIVACRSLVNPYLWKVVSLKDRKSYFDAIDACNNINSNNNNNSNGRFNFSSPSNAVQMNSLGLYLSSQNIKDPVWIDYNDIDARECWIPGGPDALCPLVYVNQTKTLIGIGVPLAVFIVFVFSVMVITSSQQVPVQKNRKYWRNLVNDLSMEEYEGVPK